MHGTHLRVLEQPAHREEHVGHILCSLGHHQVGVLMVHGHAVALVVGDDEDVAQSCEQTLQREGQRGGFVVAGDGVVAHHDVAVGPGVGRYDDLARKGDAFVIVVI